MRPIRREERRAASDSPRGVLTVSREGVCIGGGGTRARGGRRLLEATVMIVVTSKVVTGGCANGGGDEGRSPSDCEYMGGDGDDAVCGSEAAVPAGRGGLDAHCGLHFQSRLWTQRTLPILGSRVAAPTWLQVQKTC